MQEIYLSGLHCRFRFCHLFEVYRREERFEQGLRPAGLHHLSVVFHLFEVCRREERSAQGLRPAGLHHLFVVFHLFEVCRWLTFLWCLCWGVFMA